MIESINSSKVYCKFFQNKEWLFPHKVLIVAKCIVNFLYLSFFISEDTVLIVAKCIVNQDKKFKERWRGYGINSSKVYCKFSWHLWFFPSVLRINSSKVYCKSSEVIHTCPSTSVLIVAKCIVNLHVFLAYWTCFWY